MDGGIWKDWNVKYKKSGKSLCTLYTKQGFFLSLIAVSEIKILGIEVTNEEILRDMKELIALRVSV